ncbi:MAG: PAS domain-containing protein [Planctomycetes bacterium]|nr:PAS domain-containing protein [Planctomycetota bacterium]
MSVKNAAKQVIDALPEGASLDDVLRALAGAGSAERGEPELRAGQIRAERSPGEPPRAGDSSACGAAEAALANAHHDFQAILDAAPVMIACKSCDDHFIHVNAAFSRFVGLPTEQILGMTTFELVGQREVAQQGREHDLEVIRSGIPVVNQLVKWSGRGNPEGIWAQYSKLPLRDAAGTVVGTVSFVQDVDARVRAEEALRQSRSQLQSILEATTDAVFLKDLTGRFVLVNTAVCRFVGKSAAEIVGRDPTAIFPEAQARALMDRDRRVLAAGTSSTAEEYVTTADGVERTFLATKGPVFDAQGKLIGLFGISRDITERKQMEDRLRQAEKLAGIGQLAGGIAHNFNNQLTSILGFADLLLAGLDDQKFRGYALQILSSSRRAAELTAQLLAFARKGKYRSESIDLQRLIGETVSLLQQSIDKRIEIRQHFDTGHAVVLGDPPQLRDMLLNLGLNARDAMPAGGQLRFETAAIGLGQAEAVALGVEPGRYLRIAVSDSGVGMNADTQKHLFEPFFTTKSPGQGTGLGLAAVHGIVASHRGGITARSEPGQGSTFTIYLPLHGEAMSLDAEASAAAPGAVPKARVLLVDDEEGVLRLAAEMLRISGHETICCNDGAEALGRYRELGGQIDLVILDVVMPKLGGRDTFAALRQMNPAVKVLVSSGYSIDGEARSILADGALGFLPKPYNRAELVGKVAEALGGGRSPGSP